MSDNGMTSFLAEAIRQNAEVDLHLMSGSDFTRVTVSGMLRGTVEVEATENHPVTRIRKYVVVVDRIEWGVLS